MSETSPAASSSSGRGIGPVTAACSGSVAAVVIVSWALRQFAGVEMPADVAGSAAVLLSLGAGYLTPSARGKRRAE